MRNSAEKEFSSADLSKDSTTRHQVCKTGSQPSEVEAEATTSNLKTSPSPNSSNFCSPKSVIPRYVSKCFELSRPTISRPLKTFFTCMEPNNQRLGGYSGGHRLSDTISQQSSTEMFTCTNLHLPRTPNPIDQEVQELLSKGAVHYVLPNSHHEQGFISSLFVVPKKGGGHRPVINLKPLNYFIPYEHFKMESVHMLKDLIRKGDYMVKIDLKDAYLTVPVWKDHQMYLRFIWRGSLLEFSCLPFGLASAPREFTKLLKPVWSILRQRGIRLIVYLDDILLIAQSKQLVLQHASSTLNLLEGLGFILNYQKSLLVPSQQIKFLGYLVNSINLSLNLPRDKIKKVQQNC